MVETFALAPDSTLRSFDLSGHDYYKAEVTEAFSISNGVAHWKSQAEQGEKAALTKTLYIPVNSRPADSFMLVKAALANGGTIPLWPDGEARGEKVAQKQFEANGKEAMLHVFGVMRKFGFVKVPRYAFSKSYRVEIGSCLRRSGCRTRPSA
jgi:hypothetical protein